MRIDQGHSMNYHYRSNDAGLVVEVEAPARLHLGFLDLHGGLGRKFGSIGLTIDSLATRLRATKSSDITANGPAAQRALKVAKQYVQTNGLKGGVDIKLLQAIPDHVGLGSGTQMALAVGTAIERLYGGVRDSGTIAHSLNRGKRSGIGIGAFDQGGFILDCGRGEDDAIPPVPIRLEFPSSWRILLLFDSRGQGLHGKAEVGAFTELPQFPEQSAAHLCRLAMMQVVPGVMEAHLEPFAKAIGEIQQVVGDHFSSAQGGRFTSPMISAALTWLAEQGFKGVGQSSWGPTGFVLLKGQTQANSVERELKHRFGELSSFRCQQVAARNVGAEVRLLQQPTRLINQKRAR
ncbi:MAG: GHMP kinase [Candidatus Thiodiazotropha taylori]|nr:GHMP kinase [Candidatus Thiodiazotropha taylori]